MQSHRAWAVAAALCAAALGADSALAAWPAYRANNARSGVTHEPLATPLRLQWTYVPRHAPRPAWPEPGKESHRMPFDYAFQVVSDGELAFFGSSADHKVYALDLKTGRERWSFFTEGPVRFAPALAGGRLFVASDDGCLYCLAAGTGKLLWRFRGGPRDERFMGNEQMISRWPARAGVLVDGETVYFAAGMWSSDGIYLYALRTADGSVIWKNDTIAHIYIRLPHPLQEGIGGISPQGYLALWKDTLIMATGRSSPAGFDKETGEFLFFENALMKLHHPGSSWVIAGKDMVFSERRLVEPDRHVKLGEAEPAFGEGLTAWHYRTGEQTLALHNKHRAVIDADAMYATGAGSLTAIDLAALLKAAPDYVGTGKADPTIPGRVFEWPQEDGVPNKPLRWPHDTPRMSKNTLYPWFGSKVSPVTAKTFARWEAPLGRTYELILAGTTLVTGGRGKVVAFDTNTGRVVWQTDVEGQARGLAVAGGRLLVSTSSGHILCFGANKTEHPATIKATVAVQACSDSVRSRVTRLLEHTGVVGGYCLMLGAGDGQLAGELARQSKLAIYAIEPDASSARRARRMLDAAGLQGARVAVHQATLTQLPYAPYFADLIVLDTDAARLSACSARELYRVLRPCGGTAWIAPGEASPDTLAQAERWLRDGGVPAAELTRTPTSVIVRRGALPGAGTWTHQYADAGRSAASTDQLVRLPLRLLWFGGPGPDRMVSRHWYAPAPVSINGRMFVAGQHHMVAVNAYNGRELWCRELRDVARFSAQYRGGNIVADRDHVYALQGTTCLQLDAGTGDTARRYEVPREALGIAVLENPFRADKRDRGKRKPTANAAPRPNRVEWEFLAVADDLVLGSVGLPNFLWTLRPEAYPEGKYVFALRKVDGQPAWVHRVERAVDPKAIAVLGRRVILIDRTADADLRRAKHRGESAQPESSLTALDLATGKVAWQTKEELRGTMLWCGSDVVVATGGKPSAYSVETGKLLWSRSIQGSRCPVITGDTLYTYPYAYELRTGEPITRPDPLTGRATPWRIGLKGGCGVLSGCPNMLFYRAGSTGFYDLSGDSGLHYLGQVRTSCWLNTIAAGGMVLIPEGASGCTCPYSYQTSLALVPDDRHESWALFPQQQRHAPGTRIRQLRLNLGAAGDKRDGRGNLWFGYPRPFRPGTQMLPFVTDLHARFRRRNADSLRVSATDRPWLYTSNAEGMRRVELRLAIDQPAVATPCAEAPTVDGRLEEPCWDGSGALVFTTDEQAVDPNATAFLRHDADNLYVGFRRKASVRDGKPVPWTKTTEGEDQPAWKDDSVNVRLGSARSRIVYLYVSASGATYDGRGGHFPGPYWDGKWHSAVHVTAERWTVELALPWEMLAKAEVSKKRLRVYLESTNQTGVGPKRSHFKHRSWSRYGQFAGLTDVSLMGLPPSEPHRYRVALHFAELDEVNPGERVFDVKLQGQTVLTGLDVINEAGGRNVALVKEFQDIEASGTLTLEFVPRTARPPILSAMEVHEQEP